MKEISSSVFLGVLLAVPILYVLDNDPDQPLGKGAVAFILFLTIGGIQLATRLLFHKGENNGKS